MPYLGAHLSAAGGVSRAASAAGALGFDALQIFLRAPGRWQGTVIGDDEIARFRAASAAAGLQGRCFAHAPYLLNLGSPDARLRQRSGAVLAEELRLADSLGLAGLVLHPGSATGSPRKTAERRCREAIGDALDAAGTISPKLLLEGSAGAGDQLGRTPAELARLRPGGTAAAVGICLDTAHLWAAGYDLAGEGWEQVMGELAESWGRTAPDLLHGNDSQAARGSHRDRHAAPGEGALGEGFFRRILNDPRLTDVAVVVEIPPGAGNKIVRNAIARLRAWMRRGAAHRSQPCRVSSSPRERACRGPSAGS